MIIDGVAYLGHWPFRQLHHNTAETMLEWMDSSHIDAACVSSINSVFYKDVMNGNLELFEEVRKFPERLIPFAVINPEYPGWKKDFDVCIHELGMKGIEIYPNYHNYAPDSPNLKELMEMAADAGIPVRISTRLVDIRGRHWMDTPENISGEDVEKMIALCPRTNFLICSCNTASLAKKLKPLTEKREGKVLYDFSRLDNFSFMLTFQSLMETVGADSVVFGTGMPFQYPDPQFVKLYFMNFTPEELEKITSENLKTIL